MAPPRSKIWAHFTKINQEIAECRLCKKKIKTSGNTSNLKCHFNSRHKEVSVGTEKNVTTTRTDSQQIEIEIVEDECNNNMSNITLDGVEGDPKPEATSNPNEPCLKKQKTVSASLNDINSYRCGQKSFIITEAIMHMICIDCQPFSLVEDKGFRHLIKTMAPHYIIPSRKTITKYIRTKYELLSDAFKSNLNEVFYYSLTTDIWTDTLQSRSFLGITLHFLENSDLMPTTLGVFELTERHTAEYLVNELKSIFNIWGIENNKITVGVSDGAANITKALKSLLGDDRVLHCFAHRLNLVAQTAIQSIEELVALIKRVKEIVTFFKQSNNASDCLRKSQPESHLKKLIQDVPTRWNATYYMVERFLELEEIINTVLHKMPNAPRMISAIEILQLQDVLKLLRHLEAATREISSDTYTTSSLVIPLGHNIYKALLKEKPQYPVSSELQQALLKQCEQRFNQTSETSYVLSIATLLDPRFKKMYFNSPLNCAKAVEQVNLLLRREVEAEPSNSEIVRTEKNRDGKNTTYSLWEDHEEMFQQQSLQTPSLSEMASYLREPPIPLKQNPINWWKTMALTYPKLSKVALQFLSAVATSVPSERLFSKAGLTITQQRNKLKAKNVSMLLFLQSVPLKSWISK